VRPKPMTGPVSRLFALLIALALLAAACGGDDDGGGDDEGIGGDGGTTTEEEGEAQQGGDLIDLQNFSIGEPDHIDPGLADTLQSSQVPELLFDGLTVNDFETGETLPGVAESWEANEEGDVWTFQLRDDVSWSNGDPVLPSDFKFAWERAVNPEFASDLAYHFDPIVGKAEVDAGTATELSGVVADDDAMTLAVTTTAPYAPFPQVVSHTVFSPVPASIVRALPDQSQWEQGTMIGNGPFVMAEPWAHERYIKLARNDAYYGGAAGRAAYLDTIEFRITADVETGYQQFEAGQGDTGYIPPARFAEAVAKYPDHNLTDPTLGIYYYGFNQEDPVVGGPENLKLRQAMALAIDKQAINDTVYSGSRTVATGFTPPGLPGYEDGLGGDIAGQEERDLDRARELLEEWGGTVTSPIRLSFGAGAGHAEVATIVQANLQDIGISSVLDPRDTTTYFSAMRSGGGMFFRAGWIWDYVAYDNGMFSQFHSNSIDGDNLTRYSDPEVDNLIDQARGEIDEDVSFELYREAEQLVLENVIVVPLNWYNGAVVFSERVHGLTQSPLQYLSYQDAWIEE
jgi:ABC-type transport system substrate-binding protein